MSDIIKSDLANGSTARAVGEASGSAHRAIDQAVDAALPAVENIAAGAHSTVDRLASAASHTADRIDLAGGQLRDTGLRLTQAVRTQYREQPLATIGIAVAAGFALSFLLRRR
jgi:ElaB/YqjD/DUF883 family membrane-anchored ribosome-binding protein